jgi:hypothetical protein
MDLEMASKKPSNDITIPLVGQSITATGSRLAAKITTRIGKRKRGKHDREEVVGEEFTSNGRLVNKKRIIDRSNNLYVEHVADADTGEVLRNVEQPLKEHVGRGSAKGRRQ